jgi:hypothetical protein
MSIFLSGRQSSKFACYMWHYSLLPVPSQYCQIWPEWSSTHHHTSCQILILGFEWALVELLVSSENKTSRPNYFFLHPFLLLFFPHPSFLFFSFFLWPFIFLPTNILTTYYWLTYLLTLTYFNFVLSFKVIFFIFYSFARSKVLVSWFFCIATTPTTNVISR